MRASPLGMRLLRRPPQVAVSNAPTWTSATPGDWTLTNSNRTGQSPQFATTAAYTEAGQGTVDFLLESLGSFYVSIGLIPNTSASPYADTTADSGTPHVKIFNDGGSFRQVDGVSTLLTSGGTWVVNDVLRLGWNGSTLAISRLPGGGSPTLLANMDCSGDAGVIPNMRLAAAASTGTPRTLLTILPNSVWA